MLDTSMSVFVIVIHHFDAPCKKMYARKDAVFVRIKTNGSVGRGTIFTI